jgi:hypothetical protein
MTGTLSIMPSATLRAESGQPTIDVSAAIHYEMKIIKSA